MREDWGEIELGELCKFSQGVQVPKGKQYTEDNENRVRFLRIIDFTQGKDEPRYIDKPNDINIVAKDDISMVRYGTVGFVCTGIEGAIANNLFRIIPNIDIDKKFLINFLNSVTFKSQINAKGATMQALSFGLIKPIKVTLPPVVEQKAIVKKIEELFSSLDSGISDLKKAQDQLVIYRQAVLKKAFEGELTSSKMEPKQLEPFTKLITKGASPKWQGFDYINDKNELLFITSENVREGFVSLEKEKYLPKGFNNVQKRSILKIGDVLLNIVGASIGRAAIFELEKLSNINQAVCLIRLKDEELLKKYLCYYLNSETAKQDYLNKQVDVARANLSLTNVKELEIPFCSPKEQYKII
ncbi:restriction endonuclease subunit S [Balneicella halophila]|uniref:restriction endonuclease subunit S n=1 Tax=Balneicella halophila TaxID=1537566 RepID=UPI000E308822|nr:restriction endonuclease subunit S [Balneicella halophila]